MARKTAAPKTVRMVHVKTGVTVSVTTEKAERMGRELKPVPAKKTGKPATANE